jgi:DNA-binding CsgD family transcriptional regulator
VTVNQTARVIRGEVAGVSNDEHSLLSRPSDQRSTPYILIVDCDARIKFADRRNHWREIVDQVGSVEGDVLPEALASFVRQHTKQQSAHESHTTINAGSGKLLASLVPLATDQPQLYALTLARSRQEPTLQAATDRYALTRREAQILRAVMSGAPSQQIAHRFSIRLATVEWHTKRLLMKTGSSNRTEMVSRVLGWLGDDG